MECGAPAGQKAALKCQEALSSEACCLWEPCCASRATSFRQATSRTSCVSGTEPRSRFAGRIRAVMLSVTAPTGRLDHLDGLRGLSALYVVWFHVWEAIYGGPGVTPDAPVPWLGYGRAAVAVFIVISGYSLSLSLARPGVEGLPGGFTRFMARRARRILPPYYACLLLSWLFVALLPEGLWAQTPPWLEKAFSFEVVVSHLLLLHHFSKDWIWQINPPLWSIATEWSIYFLFPALLIPAWRAGGLVAVVSIGFLAPAVLGLLPLHLSLWWAAPWYLGLFALGMAAALVVGRPELARVGRGVPWLLVSTAGALAFRALLETQPWPHWSQEAAIGLAAASLLIALRPVASGPAIASIRSFLSSRMASYLGRVSYSLYLTHFLLVHVLMALLPHEPAVRLVLGLLAGTVLCLAMAHLFYLAFERPTLVASTSAVPRPSNTRPAGSPDSLR